MTKPPAMPELPEPELGYIETDKSKQPAFSARQMRVALQSAQPAEVSDESAYNLIDRFLRNNLHDDDYADYSQALDILALRPQAESEQEKELRRSLAEAQATISERNAEIIELQKRIRRSPQAVPMTDEQRREVFMAGYEAAEQDATVCQVPPHGWHCTRKAGHEGPCAAVETDDAELVQRGMDRLREAHHGITAPAGQPKE